MLHRYMTFVPLHLIHINEKFRSNDKTLLGGSGKKERACIFWKEVETSRKQLIYDKFPTFQVYSIKGK